MTIDAGAVVSLFGAALSVAAAIWIYSRQLKLELFERRIAVYDATLELLAYVSGSGRPPERQRSNDFLRKTRNAEFLFEDDVTSILEDLYKKVEEYRSRHTVWDALPPGHPDKDRRFGEQKDSFDSVHALWGPVKEAFKSYLQLKRII
jgi:hypothetical protein